MSIKDFYWGPSRPAEVLRFLTWLPFPAGRLDMEFGDKSFLTTVAQPVSYPRPEFSELDLSGFRESLDKVLAERAKWQSHAESVHGVGHPNIDELASEMRRKHYSDLLNCRIEEDTSQYYVADITGQPFELGPSNLPEDSMWQIGLGQND